MARFYTRDSRRYTSPDFIGYDYDAAILIPHDGGREGSSASQEKDLTRLLRKLRSSGEGGVPAGARFSRYGEGLLNRDFYVELDKEFWRVLGSEDGVEQAIGIFRSWIGDNCRSFSDPAFIGGIVQIRYPFEQGGLQRVKGALIATSLADIRAADYNDVMRIVFAHYIMLGMSGIFDLRPHENLALILVPVEVGGITWAVSGYIARSMNEISNERGFRFADPMGWLEKYHYMVTIRKRLESSFRHTLADLSIYWISRIFLQAATESQKFANVKEFFAYIEERIDVLERMIPLEVPHIEPAQDISDVSNENLLFKGRVRSGSDEIDLIMPGKIYKNIYFNSRSDRIFLNPAWIKDAIELWFRRGIDNAILRNQGSGN